MNIWTNLIPKAKQFSWMPRHEEEKLVQKQKKDSEMEKQFVVPSFMCDKGT